MRAEGVPTQQVEVAGGARRHGDRHIVLGAQLQVPLETCARMLWSLAFIAMRQEQHQARHAQPFHLARGDELIDDDLGAVGEIAELRLPEHQRLGLGEAVAIFEADHRFFRKQRVDHFEFGLTAADVVERHIALFGFLIDQHRVALRKGSARGILTRKPHRKAIVQERAESERFAGSPVDALACLNHLALGLHQAGNGFVNAEIFGNVRDGKPDIL